MFYIILGSFSFVLMYLFDVYTLKNRCILKRLFGISGLGLFLYSAIQVLLNADYIIHNNAVRIPSGIFFFVFFGLLIYSLFLEIPFAKTYKEKDPNKTLIDFGTYALCRHPGVLWLFLMFLFLFLLTGARLVLIAGIVWSIIDIFYVYLQEKYIFKKQFINYQLYQKTTPMLIPTKGSIKKMIKYGGKNEFTRNVKK